MSLKFILNSGKNHKWKYFLVALIRYLMPKCLFQKRLKCKLEKGLKRSDINYIQDRVNYYNKLDGKKDLPEYAKILGLHTYRNKVSSSAYFFDTYEYSRWFNLKLRWLEEPGDITEIPAYPSILKSRPIAGDNQNSVLLNLNKVRHFIFLKDRIPHRDKKNMMIFRGKVREGQGRVDFMNKFFNHPMCDAGSISGDSSSIWKVEKTTLWDHLKYKFILALEGNDVASNLKWIMSSNSVAVMPKPTYETWFMEGRLIANYHYIEIAADFSDLEDRLHYYIAHPEEAEKIIVNANKYIEQFKNKKRETLISLMVMEKYFNMTN